jgi:hypothetical protein
MAEWANIQYNGDSVGTLYFDGEKIGFVPVVQTSEAVVGLDIMTDLIKSALLLPELSASDSYFGILGSLDKREGFSYEVSTGETVEKPTADLSGADLAFTEQTPDPYGVSLDEDGNVIALIQQTPDGPLVRTNGEWTPSDPEVDIYGPNGSEYVPVTEESIAIYDRIVSNNEAPTYDDLEAVAP